MAARKLVLTYVDSLRTDMLERAVGEGRAPTFGALLERGVLIPDCVSSFPSVTPVACAELVTGVAADRHWISGMNWFHRLEQRYVEYGSSLDGLLRRAVDTTRLKFRHHTWGPAELFYGELYASREVPCKPSSIPGSRDGYSACCAVELERSGSYDFLLFSLPDNDNYSHRFGPEASVESIAKADHCFAKLVEAAGGLDKFLDEHALILVADHAQTPVSRGLPLADLLAREWTVLEPSDDKPELAQLAVSPTGRAAHIYLLPGDGERANSDDVLQRLDETEGVDLICWREGETAVVQRQGEQLRFERGDQVRDLRDRRWNITGDLGVLDGAVEDRTFLSNEYPDALARIFSAVSAPQAGDFILSLADGYEAVDWGGVSHAGGGSHGSLLSGDSLGPLLFVGCGPDDPTERQQWTLSDVAPIVLKHFGLE